jgi:ATP-binding cassette subfamily C protein CydC
LAERRLLRLDTILRFLAGLGTTVSVVATATVAQRLAGAGEIEPTTFAALMLAAFALAEAVAPLRAIAIDLGRWAVSARRLEPILLARDAASDRHTGARVGAPALRLLGVTVAGGAGALPRLAAVNLDVAPGSWVALTGPSGSGKSTLLAVLAGTLRPSAGTIDMGRAGRPRIAALGQRTELFRGTVAANLRLGRPDADEDTLLRVLSEVRLLDALGPEGLARMLGDEGSGLSGGERRRLAIARLMLLDADLVLLDEPTEGLDAATARAVFEALLAWSTGRTLVYATHRSEEAHRAQRKLEFSNGVIREREPTKLESK